MTLPINSKLNRIFLAPRVLPSPSLLHFFPQNPEIYSLSPDHIEDESWIPLPFLPNFSSIKYIKHLTSTLIIIGLCKSE